MLGLEPLFSWFGDLVAWFTSWFPKRGRIGTHERGVKIKANKVKKLEPGTYWWNARWSEIFTDNIKRKVTDLPDQTLTTDDGRRVRVGGVLIYHITNIETWLVENEDAEHGVQTEAMRVLRDFVRFHKFEEIQQYKPTKRKPDLLTRAAQEELGQDFGVWVRHLGFVGFAETRAIDLYHSGDGVPTQQPEVDDE